MRCVPISGTTLAEASTGRMQRTVIATTRSRPSRLAIALAIAWIVASLAIGTAVNAETDRDPGTDRTAVTTQT